MADFSPWGMYGYGGDQNQMTPSPTAPSTPAPPAVSGVAASVPQSAQPNTGMSVPLGGAGTPTTPTMTPKLPTQPGTGSGPGMTAAPNLPTGGPRPPMPAPAPSPAPVSQVSPTGSPWGAIGDGGAPQGGVGGLGPLLQLLAGGGAQAGGQHPIVSLLQMLGQGGWRSPGMMGTPITGASGLAPAPALQPAMERPMPAPAPQQQVPNLQMLANAAQTQAQGTGAGQQFANAGFSPGSSLVNALAQQPPPMPGGIQGIPAQNPMAAQMNALLMQQLMGRP